MTCACLTVSHLHVSALVPKISLSGHQACGLAMQVLSHLCIHARTDVTGRFEAILDCCGLAAAVTIRSGSAVCVAHLCLVLAEAPFGELRS